MKNIRITVAAALACAGVATVAMVASAGESSSPPAIPAQAIEGKTPGGKQFQIRAFTENGNDCFVLVRSGAESGGCGLGLGDSKLNVQAVLVDDEIVVFPLVDPSIDRIVVKSKKAKVAGARKQRGVARTRKVSGRPYKIAVVTVAAPAGATPLSGVQVTGVDSAGNVVATATIPEQPAPTLAETG